MIREGRRDYAEITSLAKLIYSGLILGGLVVWIQTCLDAWGLEAGSLLLMVLFVLLSGLFMLLAVINRDVMAPQFLLPSIYLFVFGVGSYLLNAKLIELGTEGYSVSYAQWFYYFLGIAAFLVGYLCSRLLLSSSTTAQIKMVRWDFTRLFIVIIVLGLVGTAARFLVYMRVGIPLLNQDIDALRSEVRDVGGVLVTMIWFSNVSVHLGSYFILRAKASKFTRFIIGAFVLLVILTMLLSGARQDVAIAVIAFVIIYHYSYSKLGLRELILLSLLIFVFIGGLGVYRIYARYGPEYINFLRLKGIPLYLSWLPELAKQLSVGIDGFAFVVHTIPNQVDYRYGWVALSPILHFLPGRQQLLDDWIKQISGGEWAGFGRPVSMIGGFYVDGGPFGIVLGMFFVGFAIYFAYCRVKAGNSPVWLLLFALWMSRLMSAWRGSLSAPYEMVLGPIILVLTHIYVKRGSIAVSDNRVETEKLSTFHQSVNRG